MNGSIPTAAASSRWLPRSSATGLSLAVVAATISGGSVWLNAQVLTRVDACGEAVTYTTAKNLVAATVIVAVASLAGRRWREAGLSRPRGSGQWGALLLVSIIGGSVPFLLFFEGLARLGKEGAVDAQAAHKASLLLLVAILGPALLREHLGPLQVGGVALVVVGYLSMGSDLLGAGSVGLVLVVAAAALWALESIVDRWLLSDMSVATVATARLGVGAVWLVLIGVFTGDTAALGRVGVSGWAWAVLTGVVLAAYAGTWLAALSAAQAVDVTAVLALAVPVTSVVNRVAEGAPLSPWYELAPLVAGSLVVAVAAWSRPPRLEPRWEPV
jgi:drug/metabolite transporter (DMT)-like permease